jgi:Na+/proline symporter
VPTLAIEHLHPIAVAVFVGAMLAAIMSSADSALLACASILANNVVPMVKRNPSPRASLLVARISIPVCGFISIFVAMKIQVVFDLILDANILALAVVTVPFIVGVWWKKANKTGALSAMAAGFCAWALTMFLAPTLPADFVGLAACLVTILIVTPLTQKIDPPTQVVDCDGNPVELTNRLGTLPLFRKA